MIGALGLGSKLSFFKFTLAAVALPQICDFFKKSQIWI